MVTKVFVTAATSQLGSLVVEDLLNGPERREIEISIGVRDLAKVPQHWTQAGVKPFKSDYTESSDQWAKTLEGQERVLLISSNSQTNTDRAQQHQNVIKGAKEAGVKVLAYTSIVNRDKHDLPIAKDHAKTEEFLKSSGIPYVFLRNGHYTENNFRSAPSWPHTKTIFSASGKGRFSFAPRKDYAAAAATVLRPSFTKTDVVFELAGDQSMNLDQYAEEISKHTPYTLRHQSLSQDEYSQLIIKFGVPQDLASIIAESDRKGGEENALENNSKELSNLIGRPTEPVAVTIAEFFRQQQS